MRYLFFLLVLVSSCRTAKVVSQSTAKDSTTTITHRAVSLEIKPDTARSTVQLTTFAQQFVKARVGTVIASKKGKRVGYTITKTGADAFDVEAVAAGKDTTVMVSDTTRRVSTRTTTTVEEQPTLVARVWTTLKDYVLYSLLLLVLIFVVLKRFLP